MHSNILDLYLCPITQEQTLDPVVAEDGKEYRTTTTPVLLDLVHRGDFLRPHTPRTAPHAWGCGIRL